MTTTLGLRMALEKGAWYGLGWKGYTRFTKKILFLTISWRMESNFTRLMTLDGLCQTLITYSMAATAGSIHFGRCYPLHRILSSHGIRHQEAYDRVRKQIRTPGIVSDYFHLTLPTGVVKEAQLQSCTRWAAIPPSVVRAVRPSAMAVGVYSAPTVQHSRYKWYEDAHMRGSSSSPRAS